MPKIDRRLTRLGIRVFGFGLLLLLDGPAFAENWTAKADFRACPRKYYPNLEGKDGPFPTKSDCEAAVERAKRADPAVCVRYSCEKEAGSATGAGAGPMDGHISDAISAGVGGQISAGDAAGLVGLGILGNLLLAPSSKNQAQHAAREAALAAERQRAIEAETAASAERLQREMLDDTDGSMDVAAADGEWTEGDLESDSGPADDRSGLLAEMMTDTPEAANPGGEQSIMGKRRTRLRPRDQPRVVLKSQPAYSAPPDPLRDALLPDPEPVRNENPQENEDERRAAEVNLAAARRGDADARECFARSAPNACTNATANGQQACLTAYENAYAAARQPVNAAIEEAFRKGRRDGPRPKPQRPPNPVGGCRDEILRAYQSGFRQDLRP